jgi:hypothetical protein
MYLVLELLCLVLFPYTVSSMSSFLCHLRSLVSFGALDSASLQYSFNTFT